MVDGWLHYGPLLVPGRSGGSSPTATATATLTVAPGSSRPPGATLAITLYFADAFSGLLGRPVSPARVGRPVSQATGERLGAVVEAVGVGVGEVGRALGIEAVELQGRGAWESRRR